jgi:hypothetical protein
MPNMKHNMLLDDAESFCLPVVSECSKKLTYSNVLLEVDSLSLRTMECM